MRRSRPAINTDTCICCRTETSDFAYSAGRNPAGRKLTICLCRHCEPLYQACRKCKCLVRGELLETGLCPSCRQSPDRPVRDIDERIDILARRPMTWERKPSMSIWDKWRNFREGSV